MELNEIPLSFCQGIQGEVTFQYGTILKQEGMGFRSQAVHNGCIMGNVGSSIFKVGPTLKAQ